MHFSLSFRFPWSFHSIALDFRWDQPSWHGEHKGSKCSYYGVEETHRAITRSKARSYPSTAHPSKPLHPSRPIFHSSNICKYAKKYLSPTTDYTMHLVTCLRNSLRCLTKPQIPLRSSVPPRPPEMQGYTGIPRIRAIFTEQEPSWLTEISERVWMSFNHLCPEFKLILSTWNCEQKRAGEMPRCLREFDTLTKDPGSVFNTHMKQLTTTWSSRSMEAKATGFCKSRAHEVHIHSLRPTHIHIK